MKKLLQALTVTISLLIGPGLVWAQDANDADKGDKKTDSPVFSYIIFSFATLIILLIVYAPTRRPVPTEET